MIVQRVVNAAVAVARDGARVVQGAAAHVLWWADHNSRGGQARKAPADPRRRPRSGD